MTHVFYVHSAITEKIARAIILHKNISKYILISNQRYNSHEDRVLNIDSIYQLGRVRFNVVRNWLPILRGDRIIRDIISDTYHLYVPQTSIISVRLLLSHKLCSGFSIMEEGLLSYCSEEDVDKKIPPKNEPMIRQIAHFNRLGPRKFYRSGYRKAYAHHSSAFPNLTNKELVSIDFNESYYNNKIKPTDCILVCESLKSMNRDNLCMHISKLNLVLKDLSDKYTTVHYKLHPDSYNNWQEDALKKIISYNCRDSKEIERGAYLDDIAVTAGVDVIVDLSTTGLYCGLHSKSDVYTYHNIMSQSVVATKHDPYWVPEIYWQLTKPFKIKPANKN